MNDYSFSKINISSWALSSKFIVVESLALGFSQRRLDEQRRNERNGGCPSASPLDRFMAR
jgi:hypothetical protein